MPQYTPPAKPANPKRRPWWIYTLGVIAVAGLGVVATLYWYRQALISKYTSHTSVPIPVPEVRPEQRKALRDKWDRFYYDLDARRPAQPLTMSSDELNAFVSMIPELKDRVRLSVVQNLIRAEFSTPLDELGLPDRYANGVILLDMRLGEDGFPALDLVSFQLNDRPPPDWFHSFVDQLGMGTVQQILDEVPVWPKLESIEIRDGRLVFSPRSVR